MRTQTPAWLGKSQGLSLRYCDIFFDFDYVFGSGVLTWELREHITRLAPHPYFLRELFKVDEEQGVALGLFDRLKPDPLPGPNQGKPRHYRHISALLLRQQLEDYRDGRPPGYHVPLDALSEREKHMLVDGFKAIRGFQSLDNASPIRYQKVRSLFA